MLNPKLKLNTKLFNPDVEQAPIRKGFGQGLLAAGELNKNVVGLSADLTESTRAILFKEKFPDRFIEMGDIYKDGTDGQEKNSTMSAEWYKRAADMPSNFFIRWTVENRMKWVREQEENGILK